MNERRMDGAFPTNPKVETLSRGNMETIVLLSLSETATTLLRQKFPEVGGSSPYSRSNLIIEEKTQAAKGVIDFARRYSLLPL